MSDNNKKRTNSFRKIFPSLFFSHKSKEKGFTKKSTSDNNFSSKANTYQNPRSIISKQEKYRTNVDDNDDRIYENLSNANRSQVDKDLETNDINSNHSSSSTLVSENVKKYVMPEKPTDVAKTFNVGYSARPQVPPKPNNEVVTSMFTQNNRGAHCQNAKFPDVYYHSMEKLTNKISPIDEIEIYKASQAQVHPTSVGAEIKKVSTKILISPKKEAEVRTIQPIRARSLSFEKDKTENIYVKNDIKKDEIKKPYNYSAPTSPIAVSHKIPNMPTTVSPYEHVRKTMFETEEKRNSLSRSSIHNKSTPSPIPQYVDPQRMSSPIPSRLTKNEDSIDKEKTRQKVEAFYWQKIKEQKEREDEYFLRQSLNSPLRSSAKFNTSYSNSNRSTPSSLAVEAKSCSLPRGRDLNFMINQPIYAAAPFVRGSQERRTDSYIMNRTSNPDPNTIYRNPEKYMLKTSPLITSHQVPIIQRGSLTQEVRNINQQMKRVSFEENLQICSMYDMSNVPTELKSLSDYNQFNNSDVSDLKVNDGTQKDPPLPPVRTTSVSSAGKNYRLADNKRITYLTAGGYSLCSESESGSEAGEIQKILQSNLNKEDDWQDGSREGGLSDGETSRGSGFSRSRGSRREDPRRHTLGGNQHLYISPHHQPPGQHDFMETLEWASIWRLEVRVLSKLEDERLAREARGPLVSSV